MRDYCQSKHKDKQRLRLLQRHFVIQLLQSQEKWESVIGDTIPRKKELSWFWTSAGHYHVQNAVVPPLHNDAQCCQWFTHTELHVRVVAARGLAIPDLEALAKYYSESGDLYSSVQVLLTCINSQSIPQQKVIEMVDRGLNLLDQIQDKNASVYELEAGLCRFGMHSDKMGSALWRSSVGRMMKLHKLGTKVDPLLLSSGLLALALVKSGATPMLLNPTAEDLVQCGKFIRQAGKLVASAWQTCTRPFEQYHWRSCKYMPVSIVSIGSQLSALGPFDDNYKKCLSLAELKETAAMYDYTMHHDLKTQTSMRSDVRLEVANEQTLASMRHSDLEASLVMGQSLVEYEAKSHVQAEIMELQYYLPLPVIRLAGGTEILCSIYSFAGLTWARLSSDDFLSSLNTVPNPAKWSLPEDRAFCQHPVSTAITAKLLLFLTTPQIVELSQIKAFLPAVDRFKYLNDKAFQMYGLGEPLGVHIASAAHGIGNSDLAVSHSRASLSRTKNEYKQMHAKHQLACALVDDE